MAKRMILVDEREYNDLWKRSPIDTTKSHLSTKLQSQLTSSDVSDDVKAKQYQNTLSRFLNLKQRIPDLQPTALNGLIEEAAPRQPAKKNTKRKHRSIQWLGLGPVRSSQRKHIKWNRHNE
jgi:hypothetical protein